MTLIEVGTLTMPLIKFIDHDGTPHDVSVAAGTSVMQAAVDNGVRGIVGQCGGGCACATCHCYVDQQWLDKFDKPGDSEQGLLECVFDPMPNSRLSCQLLVTEDHDGIVVRLPESQS